MNTTKLYPRAPPEPVTYVENRLEKVYVITGFSSSISNLKERVTNLKMKIAKTKENEGI